MLQKFIFALVACAFLGGCSPAIEDPEVSILIIGDSITKGDGVIKHYHERIQEFLGTTVTPYFIAAA